MKTVLVFKTSVSNNGKVQGLAPFLNRLINTNGRWNFDLEDCDNILRVETESPDVIAIASLLQKQGFLCEELH
ncbi:hypothetical protein HCU67_03970 [Muricauda sp. DJ-13]|uniref:Copper chaperone n=2 Tax=Croceivirga thetidis TaxID=2721623 RepID=A0ABX1GMD7_9FLAO|nr:hypothetical protein [Croceivirga thetidis]